MICTRVLNFKRQTWEIMLRFGAFVYNNKIQKGRVVARFIS